MSYYYTFYSFEKEMFASIAHSDLHFYYDIHESLVLPTPFKIIDYICRFSFYHYLNYNIILIEEVMESNSRTKYVTLIPNFTKNLKYLELYVQLEVIKTNKFAMDFIENPSKELINEYNNLFT